MVDKTPGTNRVDWQLSLYAALVGLFVFVAVEICPADTSFFLYLFVAAPILALVSIFFLVCSAISRHRHRCLRVLPALVILWVISLSFFVYDVKHPIAIRSAARWLVRSNDFKEQVLAKSAANGELKHMEWDGWGMFGQDTNAFLVFDPSDALSAAAKSHQPGKFNGIPCEVHVVRRLESQWYTVVLYTGEDWGSCL